ncbi:MAG: ribonuclease HII [bacterium]|nr:ribonuclease HII [bacterium]
MDLMEMERSFYAKGCQIIAGVDEVGRGCLAGPVYAAAVILPQDFYHSEINDSKKLTPAKRENLNDFILEKALSLKIAWVEVEEIDQINIFHAALKAMKMALQGLSKKPDLTLVDGKFPVPFEGPQETLVKGDGRSASIAAASIIAKVARDRRMGELEKLFPQFSFSQHKGYGTAVHLKELRQYGPTPFHRRSFAPVRKQFNLFGIKEKPRP